MALQQLIASSAAGSEDASISTNPLARRLLTLPPKRSESFFCSWLVALHNWRCLITSRIESTQWRANSSKLLGGKRFAFMDSSHRINLLGSKRPFAQHGQTGSWVSDLLPYTAKIVDELTFIRTCKTDLFNHAPAKLFMNTGTGLFGRPSMGSWLTYGLGSECDNLPDSSYYKVVHVGREGELYCGEAGCCHLHTKVSH